MVFYLVDYENTGIRGITGVEELSQEDRLIIFYGPRTGSVPFEDLVKITSTRAKLEFIRTTKTAKNYLDFQLTTYLGYLVAKAVELSQEGADASNEVMIISRDAGFDAVVDFWSEKGISISRFHNLARQILPDEKKTRTKATASAETKKTTKKATGSAEKKTADEKAKAAAAKNTEKKTKAQKNDKADADTVEKEGKENSGKGKNARKKEQQDTAKQNQKAASQNNNQENNNKQNQNQQNNNQQNNNGQSNNKISEAVKKKIRAAFKEEGLTPGAYRKLYACMLESKDKATFNTALVHAFTQEIGNKYYKLALPAFNAFIGAAK